MRKIRHYLGKRRLNHDLLRNGHVGVAPRLLRAHYLLAYKLRLQSTTLKFAMNGSYGARGITPALSAEHQRDLITARQAAAKGAASRLSFTEAQATYTRISQLLTNTAG